VPAFIEEAPLRIGQVDLRTRARHIQHSIQQGSAEVTAVRCPFFAAVTLDFLDGERSEDDRLETTTTTLPRGVNTDVVPGLLDNIEEKTGKTPNEFIAMAKEKGYDSPDTKAGIIVEWLKQDFGLGRGHAMALVYVIKNGAKIGHKHVGTEGTHHDESDTLRLTGKGT